MKLLKTPLCIILVRQVVLLAQKRVAPFSDSHQIHVYVKFHCVMQLFYIYQCIFSRVLLFVSGFFWLNYTELVAKFVSRACDGSTMDRPTMLIFQWINQLDNSTNLSSASSATVTDHVNDEPWVSHASAVITLFSLSWWHTHES